MRWLALLLLTACTMPHEAAPEKVASSTYDMSLDMGSTCLVNGSTTVDCRGNPRPGPVDENGSPEPIEIAPAMLIATGGDHACAAHVAGVSCWGYLGDAMPIAPIAVQGLGAVTRLDASGALTCAIDTDARLLCWTSAASPEVVLERATDVSLGGARGCAIDGDGALWCWGGAWGAVPILLEQGPIIDVAVGADHLCFVYANGKVVCEGENVDAECGDMAASIRCQNEPCTVGPTIVDVPPAIAVAVGAKHSCAITEDGAVWCWGSNEWSQVGRDDAYLRAAPQQVQGLPAVYQIDAGDVHSCARTSAGDVYCWGQIGAFEGLY